MLVLGVAGSAPPFVLTTYSRDNFLSHNLHPNRLRQMVRKKSSNEEQKGHTVRQFETKSCCTRTVSEETPFRNTRYTKAHHTPAREQPPQGRDEDRATSGQLSRAVVARPRKSRGEGRRFRCNYHWCCCSSRHPHRGCFRAPASQRFRKEEGRGANRRFLRQGHGVEERPALGSRGAGIPFGIRTDGLRVVRRQIHGKILSGGGVGRPVHSFSKHA